MWKQELLTFAEQFKHPAWGVGHCQRIYKLSHQLAQAQNAEIDEEAVFAAAYLHDIGAFEPYKQKDVDHAERSVQVVDEILTTVGFPLEKVPLVKEMIQGHMFYVEPSSQIEVLLFHDADTLDFMGYIGITRILSIVGLDDWTPDVKTAITLIRRFSKQLPKSLHTHQAQKIGKVRHAEMQTYINALSDETSRFKVL